MNSRLVIIDWRSLCQVMSYSILSGAIPCQWPTEKEEIAFRVMQRLYCFRAMYPDDTLILANDVRPYWRMSYLEDWYKNKGVEPVIYKGNREKRAWLFQTPQEEMERLYFQLKIEGAAATGARIIQDEGLEADDIWGVLTATADCNVIGWTVDSDWAQCISEKVELYNLISNERYMEIADIRLKWIGGDPGDNVKGCTKYKKDGTPSSNGWGHAGAEKLLQDPNWESILDPDELERNRVVTTLPCPLWDLNEASEALMSCIEDIPSDPGCWDKHGVTETLRKKLDDVTYRDEFVNKLRAKFQKEEDAV